MAKRASTNTGYQEYVNRKIPKEHVQLVALLPAHGVLFLAAVHAQVVHKHAHEHVHNLHAEALAQVAAGQTVQIQIHTLRPAAQAHAATALVKRLI